MANGWFQFKRFLVRQDRCAMKVGTDGVLLGAWAPLDGGTPVLDIGAGTGLVALMAAQRLEQSGCPGFHGSKCVMAVELDPAAAMQASENFAASPWSCSLECRCGNISEFDCGYRFGTILCNPPFFRDSLRCPDSLRNSARHGDSLSFEELAVCVGRLLESDGLFSAIVPVGGVPALCHAFSLQSMYPARRTDVCTVTGRPPKRSLVTFSKVLSPCQYGCLDMTGPDGGQTPEYAGLIGDFYLKG